MRMRELVVLGPTCMSTITWYTHNAGNYYNETSTASIVHNDFMYARYNNKMNHKCCHEIVQVNSNDNNY